MMPYTQKTFEQFISPEYLFDAWNLFRRGKRKRGDVAAFEYNLEENVFQLSRELSEGSYFPHAYTKIIIRDPKTRVIHKASVRDRLVHHAMSGYLEYIFERYFPSCVYSARKGQGTHKAVRHLERGVRSMSRNYRVPIWSLKCDIKSFYASVDHEILLGALRLKGVEAQAMIILERIIRGFSSQNGAGKGIPIGNLTSQIFGNIYLLPLDILLKNNLRIHEYYRYTDDFVILSRDIRGLKKVEARIRSFIFATLKLSLHERKVIYRPLSQGIDFLGYVILPFHRQLRTTTRRRMMKNLRARLTDNESGKITRTDLAQSVSSYLGMTKHADAYELSLLLQNTFITGS